MKVFRSLAMSLFGEQSDWSTITAVGSVAVGCTLFVINQVGALRKDIDAQILLLRKELEEKLSGVKKNITRVEDETTRKIQTTHERINGAEADIKSSERYLFDNIGKLKDQIIDVYKNIKG